jgi:hypothetical protein
VINAGVNLYDKYGILPSGTSSSVLLTFAFVVGKAEIILQIFPFNKTIKETGKYWYL